MVKFSFWKGSMDKKDWLVLPIFLKKGQNPYTKLLEMTNRVEEERGYRFTDEQADAIQAIITSIIDTYQHDKKR